MSGMRKMLLVQQTPAPEVTRQKLRAVTNNSINEHILPLTVPPANRAVGKTKLHTWYNRFFKRTLDLAISIPVVVCILPPLCLVSKLAHMLQSPGPLLYRQVRCGKDEKPFTIVKFRTMSVPDQGVCEIQKASSRIFPLGNLMRATKIDEIPQFLNVLQGSMSVVGPRPHHFNDCAVFEEIVADYKQRTMAKPGITGLAQYEEFRGQFEWNCTESRVANDLRYITEWTPASDITLIVQTGFVIFRNVAAAGLRRMLQPSKAPVLQVVNETDHAVAESNQRDYNNSYRKAA